MVKFHIGCGKRNFGPDWIHIDGEKYSHVISKDIFLTPFQNDFVDLIYASHVIEYLDREEVVLLLKAWYNKLKHKGKVRIAVPNFAAMVHLYHNQKVTLDKLLGPLYGKMIMNDNYIYHKTVYDFESLRKLLIECGFVGVKVYDWKKTEHAEIDDHSQAYIPHMDKKNGILISLNVEATKNE